MLIPSSYCNHNTPILKSIRLSKNLYIFFIKFVENNYFNGLKMFFFVFRHFFPANIAVNLFQSYLYPYLSTYENKNFIKFDGFFAVLIL